MIEMNEEQFEELKEKLDQIIRLLAINFVKDYKLQKDKIITFSTLGYKPSEIAKFLGTTANTVSVTLSEARREVLYERDR